MIVETLVVLQADMDDESGQVLGALVGRLLAGGALDAHLATLTMKKGRPGVRLEVLCRPGDRTRLAGMVLLETSTLGVKAHEVERYAMERRMESVEVQGERIAVKVGLWEGRAVKAAPEFEDCRAAAERLGIPVRDVLERARAAAQALVE